MSIIFQKINNQNQTTPLSQKKTSYLAKLIGNFFPCMKKPKTQDDADTLIENNPRNTQKQQTDVNSSNSSSPKKLDHKKNPQMQTNNNGITPNTRKFLDQQESKASKASKANASNQKKLTIPYIDESRDSQITIFSPRNTSTPLPSVTTQDSTQNIDPTPDTNKKVRWGQNSNQKNMDIVSKKLSYPAAHCTQVQTPQQKHKNPNIHPCSISLKIHNTSPIAKEKNQTTPSQKTIQHSANTSSTPHNRWHNSKVNSEDIHLDSSDCKTSLNKTKKQEQEQKLAFIEETNTSNEVIKKAINDLAVSFLDQCTFNEEILTEYENMKN